MVDRNLVTAKLAELVDRVQRVEAHRAPDAATLASDRDRLDLVSFNLMLAVQSCADVANHIVSDQRWAPATSLRAGFERLLEHGILTESTTASLRRAVGLRNLVAHGYATVDPEMVHAASVHGLADLRAFASEVATWMGPR